MTEAELESELTYCYCRINMALLRVNEFHCCVVDSNARQLQRQSDIMSTDTIAVVATSAHQSATMNVTEYYDDNATSFLNQSRCVEVLSQPTFTTLMIHFAMRLAAIVVGIPTNILSAIVWRRRIAGKMSSAVYLAALSINDLVQLLADGIFLYIKVFTDLERDGWWWHDAVLVYLRQFTATVEPLLVIGFSVERLIAIFRPLQVCFSRPTVLRV